MGFCVIARGRFERAIKFAMPEIRELLYFARRRSRCRRGRNFARRKDKSGAGSVLYLSAFLSALPQGRSYIWVNHNPAPGAKTGYLSRERDCVIIMSARERPRRRSGQGEPGEGTGLLSGSLLN